MSGSELREECMEGLLDVGESADCDADCGGAEGITKVSEEEL